MLIWKDVPFALVPTESDHLLEGLLRSAPRQIAYCTAAWQCLVAPEPSPAPAASPAAPCTQSCAAARPWQRAGRAGQGHRPPPWSLSVWWGLVRARGRPLAAPPCMVVPIAVLPAARAPAPHTVPPCCRSSPAPQAAGPVPVFVEAL